MVKDVDTFNMGKLIENLLEANGKSWKKTIELLIRQLYESEEVRSDLWDELKLKEVECLKTQSELFTLLANKAANDGPYPAAWLHDIISQDSLYMGLPLKNITAEPEVLSEDSDFCAQLPEEPLIDLNEKPGMTTIIGVSDDSVGNATPF